MSEQVAASRTAHEVVSNSVLFSLIFFSGAMALLPISTYFGSLNYIWPGNTTYAALSAVLAANIVLVGYIIIAARDDKSSREESQRAASKLESKKER
ncbi:hypothetical protein SISNIDRAFT_449529 [Sistotremastrum niveocremeum HHB9708]|uniref:Uncharacterized protein n=1 Tax=Sistotremastrum niveocremeum HHB9708 TaxID=1314777 RepID=A0A164ZPP9_9AGAM|nr:hypothetical protein SISNIDRAFT_449529 [Sistotremastrum niveocremeum HHB9708]